MQLTSEREGVRRVRLRYLVPLATLTLFAPAMMLVDAGGVSWLWFIVGAVGTGIAVGPFARTRFGQAIDDWFRRIGFLGRVLVILAFVAIVWMASGHLQSYPVLVSSFIVGSMLTGLVVALVERFLA